MNAQPPKAATAYWVWEYAVKPMTIAVMTPTAALRYCVVAEFDPAEDFKSYRVQATSQSG